MQIIRTYYNAGAETLKVERISIEITPPIGKVYRIGNDPGLQMGLGPQTVQEIAADSSTSLAGDRVVANIEITGSYDDLDVAAPFDMTWATKTLGNDQIVRFDMSNLSKIGDTL